MDLRRDKIRVITECTMRMQKMELRRVEGKGKIRNGFKEEVAFEQSLKG